MIKILYVPVARVTFDMEVANQYFEESKKLLDSIKAQVVVPNEILTTPDQLQEFIDINIDKVDAVLFQHITFADGEFIKAIIDKTSKPIMYWGVREPSINGRLRLNSLTGMMSTANVFYNSQVPSLYFIGNPDKDKTKEVLEQKILVVSSILYLSKLNLGVIGDYPAGFFFSGSNKKALYDAFGTTLKHYRLEEIFEKSKLVEKDQYQSEIDFAKQHVKNFQEDSEEVAMFAKFMYTIKQLAKKEELSSLAMRCWPDFFVELKTAPCGIFSQLTQQGIPTGCEADIHGALSMGILQTLSDGGVPYMGDVVSFIEENNSIVLWHCGFGPYSLANQRVGAISGLHPNRKMGFALDFGLKPGAITLFRVGYGPDGYRFIISDGNVMDRENAYIGTSGEIKLNQDVLKFMDEVLKDGVEPHLALIYGDVKKSLIDLAKYLDVPYTVY